MKLSGLKRLPRLEYVPDSEQDATLVEIRSLLVYLGLSEKWSDTIIKLVVFAFRKNYMDRRFDVANELLLKKSITSLYENIILSSADEQGDFDENKFQTNGKKVGVIMLDADFLKSFNTHFGYITGTRYLQLICAELNPETNPLLSSKLKEKKLEGLPAAPGGDEFFLVLYPREGNSTTLSEDELDEILTLIQECIEKINLEESLEINVNNIPSVIKRGIVLKKRLVASAPGSAMTFSFSNISERIHLDEVLSLKDLSRMCEVLMGETVDEIGERTKLQKDALKEARRKGDAEDRIIAEVFGRSEEGEELYQENLALKRKYAILKKIILALSITVATLATIILK